MCVCVCIVAEGYIYFLASHWALFPHVKCLRFIVVNVFLGQVLLHEIYIKKLPSVKLVDHDWKYEGNPFWLNTVTSWEGSTEATAFRLDTDAGRWCLDSTVTAVPRRHSDSGNRIWE